MHWVYLVLTAQSFTFHPIHCRIVAEVTRETLGGQDTPSLYAISNNPSNKEDAMLVDQQSSEQQTSDTQATTVALTTDTDEGIAALLNLASKTQFTLGEGSSAKTRTGFMVRVRNVGKQERNVQMLFVHSRFTHVKRTGATEVSSGLLVFHDESARATYKTTSSFSTCGFIAFLSAVMRGETNAELPAGVEVDRS